MGSRWTYLRWVPTNFWISNCPSQYDASYVWPMAVDEISLPIRVIVCSIWSYIALASRTSTLPRLSCQVFDNYFHEKEQLSDPCRGHATHVYVLSRHLEMAAPDSRHSFTPPSSMSLWLTENYCEAPAVAVPDLVLAEISRP